MMTYTYLIKGLKPDAVENLEARVKKEIPRIVQRDNDFLRACGIAPVQFQSKMKDNNMFLRIAPEAQ